MKSRGASSLRNAAKSTCASNTARSWRCACGPAARVAAVVRWPAFMRLVQAMAAVAQPGTASTTGSIGADRLAARLMSFQNDLSACWAPLRPPVTSPEAATAAFIAPALAPESAATARPGSSSNRSSTPQVKAPCEPPPCRATSRWTVWLLAISPVPFPEGSHDARLIIRSRPHSSQSHLPARPAPRRPVAGSRR